MKEHLSFASHGQLGAFCGERNGIVRPEVHVDCISVNVAYGACIAERVVGDDALVSPVNVDYPGLCSRVVRIANADFSLFNTRNVTPWLKLLMLGSASSLG